MTLPVKTIMAATNKFPFPFFPKASRSASEKVHNSAFFLAKSHPLRVAKSHPSPRPKSGTLPPRRSSRLSGGVRFDILHDMFVLGNHLRARTGECVLQFLASNFFGLESFDVNF